MALVVVMGVTMAVALGAWQLDRAETKRGYQDRYYERIGANPVTPPGEILDADFLRVRLQGQFEPERYFLVDNQIREGRAGYWVVASFLTGDLTGDTGASETGPRKTALRRWLVNLGWIAATDDRAVLPSPNLPSGPLDLVGVVWPDTGLPPLLKDDDWSGDWPKRTQRMDVRRMADLLTETVPRQVRLEGGQPGALEVATTAAEFAPTRHTGYAAQWFALAGVLLAGYVFYLFCGHRHDA